MEKLEFGQRLAMLRVKRGVSARDMSLSLGQSPAYINNIENGVIFPSMSVFFYICEYFNISPKDFFDTDTPNPIKANELLEICRSLNDRQIDNLISLVKDLRK